MNDDVSDDHVPADGIEIHVCRDDDNKPLIGILLHFNDEEDEEDGPVGIHVDYEEATEILKRLTEAIDALKRGLN